MKRVWKYVEQIMAVVAFKFLHLKISDSIWEKWCQFVKFGVVGISNTVVYYIIYVILLFSQMPYLVASIVAYLVSICNAYYWNSRFVFTNIVCKNKFETFIKTFLSYSGTGLILNNILLVLWVDCLGINEMFAPILNLVITVPVNFVLNKFWAYKRVD